MKKALILITSVLLIAGSFGFAQKAVDVQVKSDVCNPDKIIFLGDNCCPGLDLSEKQQKDFQIARLEAEKDKLPWKNRLEGKRLDFSTEMLKDNPDLGTINSIIDETAKINSEIQKRDVALKFKLRAMLTDEQKKIWDKTEGCITLDMACCSADGMTKKMIWVTKDKEEIETLPCSPEKRIEKRIEIK